MKISNIINLAVALIGFATLLTGIVILLLGCLKTDEGLITIAFIPLFVGLSLLVYIIFFICYKFFKNRK